MAGGEEAAAEGGVVVLLVSETAHTPACIAVVVQCGDGGRWTNAPIAPGLYRKVPVIEVTRVDLGQEIDLVGPTTLAFDGDREHQISEQDPVVAVVRRDGPRVVNVGVALASGASQGIFFSDSSGDPIFGYGSAADPV